MATRTDVHAPKNIIPGNYNYFTSYNLGTTQDGWPVPAFNLDIVLDLMAKESFAKTGGVGKCSVCGARFIYGDVWVHEPTGEYIHIGHECADKYNMLADRSAYELQLGNIKAAAARECAKAQKAEDRKRFLNKFPGLEAALDTDHYIVNNIKANFEQWNSLSDKQIALVMKIAAEKAKPASEQEKTVPAPQGKISFTGTVVSAKWYDSMYGTQAKMTIKVTTENGVWLAWGTVPAIILSDVGGHLDNLRGATVAITATLKPGRDAHFAIINRPAGKLIALANAA